MANNTATNPAKGGRQGIVGGVMITNPASGKDLTVVQQARNQIDGAFERKGPYLHDVRTPAPVILEQLAGRYQVADANNRASEYIPRLYSELGKRGISLSEWLEEADPAQNYTGELAKMDAYQRQLYFAGIKTRNVKDKGVFSDNVSRFFQSNVPGSQVLFPEFINRIMRQPMIAPDILPFIVATTTSINTTSYRTIYTNETESDRRMYRVDQGADLPFTFLKTQERDVRIYKYGRILRGTYEYFENVTIDLFSILLSRIALQANLDKASAAVDVIINGDGNSNPAASYNQSDLDTGLTMTYAGYLAFCLKFWPYSLTTLVGNAVSVVKFLTMAKPNVDPLQILAFLQNGTLPAVSVDLPQPLLGNVSLVYLPDAPDGTLAGIDKRFALEQIVRNGSNLVETDRHIQNQTNDVAISEKVGFAKIFAEATKLWVWNS